MKRLKIEKQVSYRGKLLIFAIFPLISLITILIWNDEGLVEGYKRILTHPGVLITDYIAVGGYYSTLLNVITVAVLNLFIIYYFRVPINGLIFASYFVSIGFSFFGKTLINILPIYFGGWLYSRHEKIKFKSIFGIMMFSSGLAPVVSFLMFRDNVSLMHGILYAVPTGVFIGFIMAPLSSHMLKFHDGYNLYNIGFAAGILGNIIASIIRGRGVEIPNYYHLSSTYDFQLKILLTVTFCIIIFIGYYVNKSSFAGYDILMASSGRTISDYILTEGYGITLLNSGILGLLFIAFTTFVGAPLNGALAAGIFTVFAFGAFGKHPVNTIPIVLGVLLASFVQNWEYNSFSVALSALFGTTLAPISGSYGPFMGMTAGFLHLFVVSNVGIIHGGMNLYNNGFSGGLVAGALVPLIHKFNLGERFNDRTY